MRMQDAVFSGDKQQGSTAAKNPYRSVESMDVDRGSNVLHVSTAEGLPRFVAFVFLLVYGDAFQLIIR